MDAWGLFDFEKPDFGDLDLMPVSIRHRLDRCGLKLSLSAWRSFSLQERESLLHATSAQGDVAWRDQLLSVVERSVAEMPMPIVPWIDPPQIPEVVRKACVDYACRVEDDAWLKLSELQRYALCKFAASKWKDRLLPGALKEFGLLGK